MRFLVALAFVAGIQTRTCMAQELAPVDRSVLYVERVEGGPKLEAVYHDVERCTGLKGDFKSLEWYMARYPRAATHDSTYGIWRKDKTGRRMVILIEPDSAELRHEALHDVLWVSGWRPSGPEDDGHPSPPFGVCAPR